MPLINVQDMPAPRLELRWRKTGDDWSHRECDYNLVIPLGAHDVRRDVYDDKGNRKGERSEWTVKLGCTTVHGGHQYLFNREKGYIDTPFRDGAHARFDAPHIGNPPVFAVYEDWAMRVEPDGPQAAEGEK